MIQKLALAALAGAAALAACSSAPTFDLPGYPGSSQASGFPSQEGPEGTLHRVRRKTPDGVQTVAAFYRKELAEARGWREVGGVGPAFADGNLRVQGAGLGAPAAAPIDPARPGGHVVVYETDNATFIEMWQWVPARR